MSNRQPSRKLQRRNQEIAAASAILTSLGIVIASAAAANSAVQVDCCNEWDGTSLYKVLHGEEVTATNKEWPLFAY